MNEIKEMIEDEESLHNHCKNCNHYHKTEKDDEGVTFWKNNCDLCDCENYD